MAPEMNAPAVDVAPAEPSVDRSAEIRTKLKQIIAGVAGLDAAKIGDHDTLREDLNLDSLSLLEIGVDVDFTFKLNLPDERYKEIQGLDDLVDLVARRLADPTRPEPA